MPPRTRLTQTATIAVSHDDIQATERTSTSGTTPRWIALEQRKSTAEAREYAGSFDYRRWRENQIAAARKNRVSATEEPSRRGKHPCGAENLPTGA